MVKTFMEAKTQRSRTPAWVWLAYRKARMWGLTLAGKNPLCRGDAAMTLLQEWESIQGLQRALKSPPRRVGGDNAGPLQWETVSGRYWTPEGAGEVIGRFHLRLCVATEHTSDLFANTVAVIDAVKEIDDRYHYVCTEAHLWPSPSRGSVLTPFNLLFYRGR